MASSGSSSHSSSESESRMEISELDGYKAPYIYKLDKIQFCSKINTRCYPAQTLKKLKDLLTNEEWMYFSKESQFQHLFHTKFEETLKMAPAAFLINHAVLVEDNCELWFVVNGVPIRYSIVEHALISGLKCGECLPGWEYKRKDKFRLKMFGNRKVSKQNVLRQLEKTPIAKVADRN
ncbi:PREDICTED: uncharacterized protein LOC104821602 [Tarenaya hassleriana]|uniref:uncharacterized protein LOC104821602 n=1 Tax=Tarenaya hassleriana TaxID=28532 RepID=UPI00053C83B4|nr:PREDICTED: uncharacterized protein LOC104821602 [Tarenaya hassleriana]